MPYSSDNNLITKPAIGFLREHQLIGNRRSPNTPPLIPIDHSTLWRWVKLGIFPQPVKIGPNTTAWVKQAVFDWIKAKGGGVLADSEVKQCAGGINPTCGHQLSSNT
jgi:prophage regulatory protein